MLKDYSVLYDNAVRPIYVGISFTCGKNSHDCIISIRGEFWSHKTSLTPPRFIEVPLPSLERQRSYICM